MLHKFCTKKKEVFYAVVDKFVSCFSHLKIEKKYSASKAVLWKDWLNFKLIIKLLIRRTWISRCTAIFVGFQQARRELERQRQMEWERQRKEQLMAEKQREYEQLAILKSQSTNLKCELESLVCWTFLYLILVMDSLDFFNRLLGFKCKAIWVWCLCYWEVMCYLAYIFHFDKCNFVDQSFVISNTLVDLFLLFDFTAVSNNSVQKFIGHMKPASSVNMIH